MQGMQRIENGDDGKRGRSRNKNAWLPGVCGSYFSPAPALAGSRRIWAEWNVTVDSLAENTNEAI